MKQQCFLKVKELLAGRLLFVGNNYNNSLNGNNNLNNNGRFAGITWAMPRHLQMKTYNNLWQNLCNYENLESAFRKARKHKTKKLYVIEFEKNLKENLLQLRTELLLYAYRPRPLETFILRDPKTRKISKSDFRDRVVHHALCNIIEPIFDKSFIHDSYANRKGKGTLKAIGRFDCFKRKVSKNNTRKCFILKADIKHYFETVDHNTLLEIINKKIKDSNVLWLIKKILQNYQTKEHGKGMPLGNLTSQFFANVYLNELDQFIKHELKAKYYIRYVDDFIIPNNSRIILLDYKEKINEFLKTIKLELHPDKTKIVSINRGVSLLGFRVFTYHKLLKKSNIRKMENKLLRFREQFENNKTKYDKIYAGIEGWLAYAHHGNTYELRKRFLKKFEELFPNQVANVEISRWIKILKG